MSQENLSLALPTRSDTNQAVQLQKLATILVSDLETTVKFQNFLTPEKLCCNLSKIQTKNPNPKVFCQKHANGITNSEDPDQLEEQSDLGPRPICPKT